MFGLNKAKKAIPVDIDWVKFTEMKQGFAKKNSDLDFNILDIHSDNGT